MAQTPERPPHPTGEPGSTDRHPPAPSSPDQRPPEGPGPIPDPLDPNVPHEKKE